jgi:hypothetical protein
MLEWPENMGLEKTGGLVKIFFEAACNGQYYFTFY